MPDATNTTTPETTAPIVNFTEAQVQALVTSIFNSVNTRIADRIVQSLVAGDTKHVASADAVKTAVDAAAAAAQTNADAIADLTGKVGEGTEAVKAYTDEQVAELRTDVMGMNHWDIVPVTGALPETLAEKTIYLQRDSETDTTWEMNILTSQGVANIGRTEIDLSNYWSKDNVDGIINALFGSELFGTKMGELLSASLASYTENTLDGRYWKKDAINDLVTEIKSKLDTDHGFFRLDDRFSWYAFFDAIANDSLHGTTLNLHLNGQFADHFEPARLKMGLLAWSELRTAAGIPYREDGKVVEQTTENIIRAIKAIAETADLSGSYLAIAKMKELLGIDGDLTTEAVEQAILTIVQSNEVESIPITDEKINSIVSAAFAASNPGLDHAPPLTEDETSLKTFTPKVGTMSVCNMWGDTYKYGLNALLPDEVLTNLDLSDGSLVYTLADANIGSYYAGNASISGQTLTLPIRQVSESTTGVVGTVTVRISVQGFEDVTATINVEASNTMPLTGGEPTLSTDMSVVGAPIGDITMTGRCTDFSDNAVNGVFTWDTPNAAPVTPGNYVAGWTFIPDDTNQYNVRTGVSIIKVGNSYR